MKKKVKLLTSIASLGLALALMTFGVLAAASQTLSVDSTVSFVAESVYVNVNANVSGYCATEGVNASTIDATVDTASMQYGDTYAFTADTTKAAPATLPGWTIGDLHFSEANTAIVYHFEFTNASNIAAKVSVTAPSAPTGTKVEDRIGEAEYAVAAGMSEQAIAVTPGSVSYDLKITLVNFTQSFNPADLDLVFTIAMA